MDIKLRLKLLQKDAIKLSMKQENQTFDWEQRLIQGNIDKTQNDANG